MSYGFVFPSLESYRHKPKPKRDRRWQTGGKPKYDHWAMAQDRIAGMTWGEIAAKHGIPGGHRAPHIARYLVLHSSRTVMKLTPAEVAKL